MMMLVLDISVDLHSICTELDVAPSYSPRKVLLLICVTAHNPSSMLQLQLRYLSPNCGSVTLITLRWSGNLIKVIYSRV